MGGERLGRRARQQRRILSRRYRRHEGSSPTIGAPAATWGQALDHALRLDPGLVDEAGGEKVRPQHNGRPRPGSGLRTR